MISVIIITRNEECNIARTIKALKDERIVEIILVDSNSTDRTVDIVKSLNESRIKLFIYTRPPFTSARGRSEGSLQINRSNSYLLFLDGDMEYDSCFTDSAIKELEADPSLAGIMGQREEHCYNDEGKLVFIDENYYKENRLIIGGGLFLKMAEYCKTPGFNKNLICDEEGFLYSFFKKNGVYFKRLPQRMFIHHTTASISKRHLIRRLTDQRLLCGLGVSFYYSIRNWFLLKSFCQRNALTIYTGIWLILIVCKTPIFIIFPTTIFLFWKYRFRVRLFMNYSIFFVSIFIGFIYAFSKECTNNINHKNTL